MGTDNGGRFIGYLVAFVGAAFFAAIAAIVQYGGVAKQVEINTGRLDRIERTIESLRDDDANFKAQLNVIERRVQRLEKEPR